MKLGGTIWMMVLAGGLVTAVTQGKDVIELVQSRATLTLNQSSKVIDVSTTEELLMLTKNGIVLVDFWAPWCAPCRMMTPVLDSLAERMENKVTIVRLNIEENPELADEIWIEAIPTMVIFKDGKPLIIKKGVLDIESLEELLQRVEDIPKHGTSMRKSKSINI